MPDVFHVLPQYHPLMRSVGLDAEAVFTHPDIVAWRTLPDRENCTLDAQRDGKPVRLHIKRYPAPTSMADDEVKAIKRLQQAGIATVPLVGWGRLADGRSFVITEDLAGFRDSEKLVSEGMPFSLLLVVTAHLAARLHDARLHHRDLYLCHFFARVSGDRSCDVGLRLIDVARVKRLPRLFARRWIVKDLAQFWYSTTKLPVTDDERVAWLDRYAKARKLSFVGALRRAIERKVRWIARHDTKLTVSQPARNVSIPSSSMSGGGRSGG
ncbi:MAG: lipopolysaccharide kinase InaA family protein [Tepidisphaeraceae bacterium]